MTAFLYFPIEPAFHMLFHAALSGLSLLLSFCFFYHFSSNFLVFFLLSRLSLPTSVTTILYLPNPRHLVLLGCSWQTFNIAQGVGFLLEYTPFWGLGWQMLMLQLCLHTVGGILQKFLVSGVKSVTRTKTLFPNIGVSAREDNIKVTWKKVEQRRLQGMVYIPLKVVNLRRKL